MTRLGIYYVWCQLDEVICLTGFFIYGERACTRIKDGIVVNFAESGKFRG